MKQRLAVLVVVVLAALGAVSATPAAPISTRPVAAAKPCSSGWTHAVIGGEHKCLRAGQFCVRSRDREYHRYRYHCHRYDARVRRYRLSR
jgi:hypothetical protein